MKTVSVNGTETARYDYVYSDGKLILLTYTANGVANTARFVYDSFGEPRGFILNDSATYLYLKNGQGDITAIIGEDGEILVRYEYNAWGAVEFIVPFGVDPAVTSILATVSPFTYRGYCYDYDIGMYYLQSRYYDPQICRFINADSTDYLGATDTVLSYNLFAYCENDGVNFVDATGTWGKDVHQGYYTQRKKNKKIVTYRYEGVYVPYISGKGYYGTYYWARFVGFNKSISKKLGEFSNAVDTLIPPVPIGENQSWHFNTWSSWDSREFLSLMCTMNACAYLDEALENYKTNKYRSRIYLGYAIQYIGFALHPIQDIYAHTPNVSIRKTKAGVSYWSHLDFPDVDVASKHINAVFNQTGKRTISILKFFYKEYKKLFVNLKPIYITESSVLLSNNTYFLV